MVARTLGLDSHLLSRCLSLNRYWSAALRAIPSFSRYRFLPALLSSISWARVLSATNVKTARFARLKDAHVWCNGWEALPVFLVQSQLMSSCRSQISSAFFSPLGKKSGSESCSMNRTDDLPSAGSDSCASWF
ncbi:uncharacterized protein BT62DRAFT_57844 [Guyanagaster necrorhizus]|uniref:Uncharacterized protein n=1 Tax=Guyanagaster necrorhizus TaxID=856835 RepID=A0A9P7W8H1_9AGAR|nr:uncharacterized protein BT62DRAFT_57844 [Guyanagaster necrorhizus MCA 3950]KAG7453281.1 hypothetical protein BT62DRAFT_57844 [Guyanagaster necrorhizus MCA 3950]